MGKLILSNKITMKHIILIAFILFNYLINAQSKKEQIEILNIRIDSLKEVLKNEQKVNLDKLNEISVLTEKVQSLQQIREKDITEIEKLTRTNKKLEEKIGVLDSELTELKLNQERFQIKLPFSAVYIDNVKSHFLQPIIETLYKYPEKTSIPQNLWDTKPTSELKEVYSWERDGLTYLFIIIVNNKAVPNPSQYSGEGDIAQYGTQIIFNNFLLKIIESEYIVVNSWESPLETCFVSLESDIIGKNIDFQLTDIDNDSNFEIWYVIESICSLGIEPSKLDIFLINNSKLYKMESVTNSENLFTDKEILEWIKNGDKYLINKFDTDFEKLPDSFKSYAIELRKKNIYGFKN